MNLKENWIQETLNSVDNIKRIEVSSQLAERLSNVSFPEGKIIAMLPFVKWIAAACIVLLAGINLVSITQYNKTITTNQTVSNPVYSEYFSYLNTLK